MIEQPEEEKEMLNTSLTEGYRQRASNYARKAAGKLTCFKKIFGKAPDENSTVYTICDEDLGEMTEQE